MELHLEDQTPAADAAEAAPVRRRASRRVSAAAGAAPEVAADAAVTVTEPAAAPAAAAPTASAADAAPATDAAAEAAPEKAAPKRASRSRKKVEPEAAPAADAAAEATAPAAAAQQSEDAAAEPAAEPVAEAPKRRATRSRKAAVAEPAPEADKPAEQASEAAADSGAQAPAAETADAKTADAKSADAKTAGAADTGAATDSKAADSKAADSQAAETGSAADEGDAQPARRSRRRATQATEQAETDTQAPSEDSKRRGRGGSQNAAKGDAAQGDASRSDRADRGDRNDRSDRNDRNDRSDRNDRNDRNDRADRSDRSDAAKGDAAKAEAAKSDSDTQGQSDANKQENGSRSSRTRQRDRKRRGGDDLEPEIAEDDVLLPVAGILDVLDNYAFVRTSGYLPGVSDVYVALGQVKKYSLRRGDALVGAIRQPREGDSGGRQKYNAIVKIDSVNGKPVEETETRPEITEMTPVFPQQRLKLDAGTDRALGRAIDAIAPIGLGQRGLLVLPEQFSGSEVIRELAADISANAPETHLMVVLTDAQPEVATELSRTISGEVVAATFDRLPEDQTTISELGIDRARRLVELGHDVVVLVDSLNRLARGYAQSQQPASRPAIGAVDEHAIFQVKRLLAAARNVENGGSLTVLATVRAENGNEADTILLREVKGVVNSVIEFDANSTIDAPKLNAQSSRTQHLSAMLDAKELAAVNATRAKQLAAKPAAK